MFKGCIEYLGMKGDIQETQSFSEEESFKREIEECDSFGIPIRITTNKHPGDGFIKSLNPVSNHLEVIT